VFVCERGAFPTASSSLEPPISEERGGRESVEGVKQQRVKSPRTGEGSHRRHLPLSPASTFAA
ncbi:hypothetical protein U1Q18_005189, partial [Sarracenia purpurea var. burkii]